MIWLCDLKIRLLVWFSIFIFNWFGAPFFAWKDWLEATIFFLTLIGKYEYVSFIIVHPVCKWNHPHLCEANVVIVICSYCVVFSENRGCKNCSIFGAWRVSLHKEWAAHSGHRRWQNPFSNSKRLNSNWAFWMLLDIFLAKFNLLTILKHD